jgi:DNA-binding response OmpR family regulator
MNVVFSAYPARDSFRFRASLLLNVVSTIQKKHNEALVLDGWILVVEDEDGIRETIAGYLRARGADVLCAKNGMDALARFAERPTKLALLITDVAMPDMSGLSLAESLKTNRYDGGHIFISGGMSRQEICDLYMEHRTRYLQKPFKLAQLENAIREVTSTSSIP